MSFQQTRHMVHPKAVTIAAARLATVRSQECDILAQLEG